MKCLLVVIPLAEIICGRFLGHVCLIPLIPGFDPCIGVVFDMRILCLFILELVVYGSVDIVVYGGFGIVPPEITKSVILNPSAALRYIYLGLGIISRRHK